MGGRGTVVITIMVLACGSISRGGMECTNTVYNKYHVLPKTCPGGSYTYICMTTTHKIFQSSFTNDFFYIVFQCYIYCHILKFNQTLLFCYSKSSPMFHNPGIISMDGDALLYLL